MASKAAGVGLPWCRPSVRGGKNLPRRELDFRAQATRYPKQQRPLKGDPRAPTVIRCSAGNTSGETSPDSDSLSARGKESPGSFWSKWKENSADMSSKLAKLGLAAVLAYGILDAVTYTTFFTLAFLGYEKSTGNNPAANLKALLGIVILMWTGNNVTRPFRVAGAAALAPAIDELLKKIQKKFNLSSQMYAFALVVALMAGTCLSFIGLLILSRWGK